VHGNSANVMPVMTRKFLSGHILTDSTQRDKWKYYGLKVKSHSGLIRKQNCCIFQWNILSFNI